jgi:exonuclease SbcD
MFKFIHTSDWHLGQNFYGYDRSEEQADFLRQLVDIVRQHQPDALLVSGDIFHTAAPSSAAVTLYVNAMLDIHNACPKMAIVVIAGNHDSASRLQCDSRLWELAGVRVLGGIARDSEGLADLDRHIIHVKDKGIVAAVPFAYPASFPLVNDEHVGSDQRQPVYFQSLLDHVNAQNPAQLPVVLMAHLAVNGSDFTGHEVGMMECVEVGVLGNGYDYAALGHIHRPQDVSERARYCGTPLAVSFDEQCEHSVSIVEIDAHGSMPRVTTERIENIKPLRTIPAGPPVDFEAALEQLQVLVPDERAYVRLNVLVDRYLPNGAQERAALAVADKQCRFCEIKKTATVEASHAVSQMTMEEFNHKHPIEVAQQFYLEKYQREMTDEEKEMFNYVYRLVQEEARQ